jgi:hypothetical protein
MNKINSNKIFKNKDGQILFVILKSRYVKKIWRNGFATLTLPLKVLF